MEDNEAYKKAKEKVEAKIGFYIHLGLYIIINAILFIIDKASTPEETWFYWPLIGWGIGLLFHGIGVFVSTSKFRERMIEKEIEKQKDKEIIEKDKEIEQLKA